MICSLAPLATLAELCWMPGTEATVAFCPGSGLLVTLNVPLPVIAPMVCDPAFTLNVPLLAMATELPVPGRKHVVEHGQTPLFADVESETMKP